jgi:hypothetical protein
VAGPIGAASDYVCPTDESEALTGSSGLTRSLNSPGGLLLVLFHGLPMKWQALLAAAPGEHVTSPQVVPFSVEERTVTSVAPSVAGMERFG